MSDDQQIAGLRLKALREAKGWSQEKLAQESGIGDKTLISKLESGRIRNNDIKLLRLSQALGCEPGDLLRRDSGNEVASITDEDAALFNEARQVMSGKDLEDLRTYLRIKIEMARARGYDDGSSRS